MNNNTNSLYALNVYRVRIKHQSGLSQEMGDLPSYSWMTVVSPHDDITVIKGEAEAMFVDEHYHNDVDSTVEATTVELFERLSRCVMGDRRVDWFANRGVRE